PLVEAVDQRAQPVDLRGEDAAGDGDALAFARSVALNYRVFWHEPAESLHETGANAAPVMGPAEQEPQCRAAKPPAGICAWHPRCQPNAAAARRGTLSRLNARKRRLRANRRGRGARAS